MSSSMTIVPAFEELIPTRVEARESTHTLGHTPKAATNEDSPKTEPTEAWEESEVGREEQERG